MTYASNEVRFYRNGQLTDSITPLQYGGAISDDLENVQLGWDSCGSYFVGSMDEVALYNVTLTDQQVNDLYLKGVSGRAVCQQDPQTKDDCKKGGWEDFGFRNQGTCIRYVNTGKDNRL